METADGLTVIEVNSGGEFRGLMATTDTDIAAEIVSEAMETARRGRPERRAAAKSMAVGPMAI